MQGALGLRPCCPAAQMSWKYPPNTHTDGWCVFGQLNMYNWGVRNAPKQPTEHQACTSWGKLGSGFRENGERMRKWRANEKIERKWREWENGEMEKGREMEIYSPFSHAVTIFSLFPHFLSIFSLSIFSFSRHFLILLLFSLSLSISSISVHFQNWPALVCADLLLKRAMDKFFKDKNPRGDGRWHMYHSDETRFYPQNESRAMRRLQKEKSKLSFVDALLPKEICF